MSRSKRGRASPALHTGTSSPQSAWKSVETLLCKELGACDYETALFNALPASTQRHLLEKWSMYKPKVPHLRRELEMAYKLRHNTDSIPEEIAVLAENKAAEAGAAAEGAAAAGDVGKDANVSEVLKRLPFAARLLVLWHAQKPAQIPELVQLLVNRSELEHAENILMARCESTRRRIAEPLNGKYRVVLQLEFQENATLVRLSDVHALPVLTFADMCLETGRLVKVKLPKPKHMKKAAHEGGKPGRNKKAAVIAKEHDRYTNLARHGFMFAGEHFEPFGSKDARSLSWYFIRRKEDADVPHAAMLRDVMGDWRALPNAAVLACRLELALGGVAAGPKLEDSQIELIDDDDDLVADISSSKGAHTGSHAVDLTDGSGYISPDLAELVAPRVSQGQASWDSSEQPAALQIRLICALGCFKGTLLVKEGFRSKVQLRRSMLKIPGRSSASDDSKCGVDADMLQGLDGYNRLLIVNTSREASNDAELNKHLLLMLTACARDDAHRAQLRDYFRALFRESIHRLQDATRDRSAAYEYCAAAACLRNTKEDAAMNTLGSVLEMLLAGHRLQEPYLTSLLYKHVQQDWDRLCALRIQCPDSCYLMGVPDPTGSLQPGEVYVRPQRATCALQGPIVVARFPLVLPSSVKSFQAVKSASIETQLQNRAGVIVFSCMGKRSPVEAMGGDYDGDLYYINWNQAVTSACYRARDDEDGPTHTEECKEEKDAEEDAFIDGGRGGGDQAIPLVQPVIDVARATPASTAAHSDRKRGSDACFSPVYLQQLLSAPVSQLPAELVDGVLMHEWLHFLGNDLMGLSATQWLIHADRRGVCHPNTVRWGELHHQSLQARKHSTQITQHHTLPPQLDKYPDFMGKPASMSYESTSILGEMHNMVRERHPSLEPNFQDFELDRDMFHSKAKNYIQVLNDWLSDYAQSVSTIMAETSDEAERQTRIDDVVRRYERMLHELARTESQRHNRPSVDFEEAIASAMYEVCCLRFREVLQRTTTRPKQSSNTIAAYFAPQKKPPVHYLRFCWRICGSILNRMKLKAKADRVADVADSLQNLRLSQDTSHNAQLPEHASRDLVCVSRAELHLLIQALRERR